MEKLEKIDLICQRLDVSYSEANEALEETNGDVVAALIKLENENNDTVKKDFKVKGNELVDRIKELIKEGNIKKISVKNEVGESLVEIPVTAGVVGLVLFPYIGILGGLAAMLKEYTLEIEKEEE